MENDPQSNGFNRSEDQKRGQVQLREGRTDVIAGAVWPDSNNLKIGGHEMN
jgi:hypothetical protein